MPDNYPIDWQEDDDDEEEPVNGKGSTRRPKVISDKEISFPKVKEGIFSV